LIPSLQIESFKLGQKYDVILASGGSLDAEKNLAVDSEVPTSVARSKNLPCLARCWKL
jgi:hypothetical protein